MATLLHQNYVKAANLTIFTVLLGISNFFLSPSMLASTTSVATVVVTLTIIIVLSLFVRKGKGWVKWVFLVLAVLDVLGVPVIIEQFKGEIVTAIIHVVQLLIQIYVLILLFRMSKTKVEQSVNN